VTERLSDLERVGARRDHEQGERVTKVVEFESSPRQIVSSISSEYRSSIAQMISGRKRAAYILGEWISVARH
jgi:hypothetical protein